jgi:hypothetical protein
MLYTIVSAGASAAELAALQAAETYGIPTGGLAVPDWANDRGDPAALLRDRFGLHLGPEDPAARLMANAASADATLLCCLDFTTPGTVHALRILGSLGKPYLPFRLTPGAGHARVQAWLLEHQVRTLHITGNRERASRPSVFHLTTQLLWRLFAACGHTPRTASVAAGEASNRRGTLATV